MFPDTHLEVVPAISDVELVAHVVRLLRSENFNTGRQILDEMAKAFPMEDAKRIRGCALEATKKMAAQHDSARMFINGRMITIPLE